LNLRVANPKPYKRTIVSSMKMAGRVVDYLRNQERIAVDLETNSLHWYRSDRKDKKAYICGICMGTPNHGFYFPTRIRYVPDRNKNLHYRQLMNLVKPLLRDKNVEKIFHHYKFDAHFLANEGITVRGRIFDTLDIHKILFINELSHKLKDLVKKYHLVEDCGETKDALDEKRNAIAKYNRKRKFGPVKKNDVSYDYIPLDTIGPYGCDDAVYTYRLWEVLWEAIEFRPKLKNIVKKEQIL